MLAYLYPQTTTLENAVETLMDSPSPLLPRGNSGENQTYLDTCRLTLVGCDYPGKFEKFAGKVDSLLCGYETRQRTVERRNPSLMLKSIMTSVKSVSSLCNMSFTDSPHNFLKIIWESKSMALKITWQLLP